LGVSKPGDFCIDVVMETAETLIVAIDGGGTRCRIVAQVGSDRTMVETGSANVSSDFAAAMRQIDLGLNGLARRLDVSMETLASVPAYVGLAGVTGTAIAERVRMALPFRQARVEDDRVAAVRGSLGARDGVIAHCGTGSFFAAQSGTKIRLMGGWGPVLGDEASAQWVGRRALSYTLDHVDGRRPASALAERLLAQFKDAAGIVAFASTARPAQLGALAPLVTASAMEGDALARRIMQDGAQEIDRAVRDLDWRIGQPLCLTGGIGSLYAEFLPADLRTALTDPAGEPLDGALALAEAYAREIALPGPEARQVR
jgi:glucosamine kinase